MNKMTNDAYQENTKCRGVSEKKMEKDGWLRTVECLRGRLLAERRSSKAAKEAAEQLNRKIVELEAHLEEEIKRTKKAEKKLKFLMKKLESLKGSCNSEGSEQSSSPEVSAVSCVSSNFTSRSKQEEYPETKTRIINLEETHVYDGGVAKTESDQVNENVLSIEENSSSKLKDLSSGNVSVASTTSHEEAKTGNSSSRVNLNKDKASYRDDEDAEESLWALVALEVSSPKRDNKEPKIEDESVVEVLKELWSAKRGLRDHLLKEEEKLENNLSLSLDSVY